MTRIWILILLRSANGQSQEQYWSQMKYLRWQRRCIQSIELSIFKQVSRLSTSALANSEIIQIKARTPKTQNKRQKELITELTGQAIKQLLHKLSATGSREQSSQLGFPNRYLQPKLANAVDTKRQDHAASTSGSSYKSLSWSSSAIRYWISSQSDESSIARSSLSICRSRSKDIWQETGKTIKPNSEGDATPKAQIKKRQRGYNCFDARLITNNWPWLGVTWEKRSKKTLGIESQLLTKNIVKQ